MAYYVYKSVGRPRRSRWELASRHEDLADAISSAEALCPKGSQIYTEPSRELEKAFFGPSDGDRWSAMITTTPERG